MKTSGANRSALASRLGLIGLVTVLVASAAGPSTTWGTDEAKAPEAFGENEALRSHAAGLAADFGTSVDEAHRRLAVQDDLTEIVRAIKAVDPSRFAGAWIEHQPDFRVVVRLKGSRPVLDEVKVIAQSAPAPVHFMEGGTHSVIEMEQALDRVAIRLRERAVDSGTWLDIRAGQIVVGHQGPEKEISELLRAESTVPIRYEDQGELTLLHTYGGRQLEFSGERWCSTGFTIRLRNTTTTGVLTAAHCPNSLTYVEREGVRYPVVTQGERWDPDQDVQWMIDSSGHAEFSTFWDGAAFVNVVGTMARLQMVGHGVCHWGAETGRSCGIVQTIHDNHGGDKCGPFQNEPCEATWVRVTGSNLRCEQHDSGGPWFTGGTAWGTMVGAYGPLPSNDCIFMSIGFITEMGLLLRGLD